MTRISQPFKGLGKEFLENGAAKVDNIVKV